jgi:hypothetical protein
MSRFHTPIPVDLEAIKKLLPQRGVHVHGVVVTQAKDHKDVKVVIDWECSELRTGFTFPVEFSVADLQAKKLPKGVTFLTDKAPVAKAPAAKVQQTAPTPQQKPATAPAPKVKTPKAKAAAKAPAPAPTPQQKPDPAK